jgi:hypothetical protein
MIKIIVEKVPDFFLMKPSLTPAGKLMPAGIQVVKVS